MKKGIPIIYIHNGNSNYLYYTFSQVIATNPDSEIYLIGTNATKHYESIINHIDIKKYFSEADEFTKVYKHFSTNGYDFELMCLQRWFVLKAFMLDNNIDRCVYLDSDILVYSNLSKEAEALKDYSMSILGISPHTNFINGRSFFIQFCEYLKQSYDSPNSFGSLHEKYIKYVSDRGGGGISDMTFFFDYKQKFPDKIVDISEIRNDATFDITLDTPNGYEMEEGIKKIVWQNHQPFCKYIQTGKLIKFHSLHFQGKMKKYIGKFLTKKSPAFYFNSLYFTIIFMKGKVFGKLKKTFKMN